MNISPLSHDDCKIFIANGKPYCYVPITKVASTYLRSALPGRSFDIKNWCWSYAEEQLRFANLTLPKARTLRYLVVLRDPLERWISGATEYWCRAAGGPDWTMINGNDPVLEKIQFDVHTLPQCEFLANIDFSRTTWLWLDQSIENHSWFGINQVQLLPVANPLRNWGNSRPQLWFNDDQRFTVPTPGATASVPSATIQNRLRYFIKNSHNLVNKIKKFYHKDYDLINSVKFK